MEPISYHHRTSYRRQRNNKTNQGKDGSDVRRKKYSRSQRNQHTPRVYDEQCHNLWSVRTRSLADAQDKSLHPIDRRSSVDENKSSVERNEMSIGPADDSVRMVKEALARISADPSYVVLKRPHRSYYVATHKGGCLGRCNAMCCNGMLDDGGFCGGLNCCGYCDRERKYLHSIGGPVEDIDYRRMKRMKRGCCGCFC